MSGIDKIKAHLASDCDAECAKIAADADAKAKAITAEAEETAKTKADAIVAAAEKQATEIIRLAEASAQMKARQNVLTAKVETLNAVLADALSALNGMTDDEYYKTLEALAVKNAQNGNGVLLIKDDVPDSFMKNINTAIADKGVLELGKTADIKDKGIVLVYGDIEINLTFKALVDAGADELKETAQKILF